MQRKSMTWAELKEAVNKLPEENLQQPVRWWGNERGGVISYVNLLDEDYVCDDEGWQPKSCFEGVPEDEYEVNEELLKGSPVLMTDDWEDETPAIHPIDKMFAPDIFKK